MSASQSQCNNSTPHLTFTEMLNTEIPELSGITPDMKQNHPRKTTPQLAALHLETNFIHFIFSSLNAYAKLGRLYGKMWIRECLKKRMTWIPFKKCWKFLVVSKSSLVGRFAGVFHEMNSRVAIVDSWGGGNNLCTVRFWWGLFFLPQRK